MTMTAFFCDLSSYQLIVFSGFKVVLFDAWKLEVISSCQSLRNTTIVGSLIIIPNYCKNKERQITIIILLLHKKQRKTNYNYHSIVTQIILTEDRVYHWKINITDRLGYEFITYRLILLEWYYSISGRLVLRSPSLFAKKKSKKKKMKPPPKNRN